ncbi:PREDICTED: pigment epithelium-derived factor isoform X2 [Poecilia mexicana]|uniref:Serpin domain-containing protein n=2 Tax=Poecilia mexicana TaxID=48701 RepID=A0A3B3WF99_9TELE|nr:PREDICTED: pigment epithelium-derived factor isoform X2 [Poecilia mexicana]
MKRTTFLLALAAVLSICWAQSDSGGEEAAVEEEHVELFTTPATKMGAATSDFGYNLFRALTSRETSANLFLSPISVSAVLTQLSMGGSENAQRQLYRALRYHTLQDPQLQNTLKDLLASVNSSGKGLSSAARLYVTRRLRLKQDFFKLVEQQYGVRPKALLGGAKDTKEINDWVSQQTGRKVQQFLTKALPRTAGINAISAAYFKGGWVTRFSQGGVQQDFQVENGAPVRVPMMQQDNYPVKMGVDSDLSCTIAQIQMQNDISMFVFLPDVVTTNTTLLEESLTAEFVQDLSMALQPARVSLTLPVLRLSYSTDLLPLLGDLGLNDWLDNQELEKISVQSAKLTSINHKVVMETAPEGAQYPSAVSVPSHLTYRVDRPFVYLIRDEPSGALLFIGKVVNPKDLTI